MPTVEHRHITRVRPLISPAVLAEEIEVTPEDEQRVADHRRAIENILDGTDPRKVVVVGPCSVHDPDAAMAYARKLSEGTAHLKKRLLIVMRVYFEKPRTVVGWKGLINDPDRDGSHQINRGLRLARTLMRDIVQLGLPTGTEFLDTTFGQYYADLVSWGAIGARTVESQIHRELASGLSMPVGIKNRTDGDLQVAIDAIRSAAHKHLFPSLTKEGAPAIFETGGNPYCHLILRGGNVSGPNYNDASLQAATDMLQQHELAPNLIVDCSHGNSEKDHNRQVQVVDSLIASNNPNVKGIMLESHLVAGRQNHEGSELTYGQSITDACLGIDETLALLERYAEAQS